jgi:hypothetical protein
MPGIRILKNQESLTELSLVFYLAPLIPLEFSLDRRI